MLLIYLIPLLFQLYIGGVISFLDFTSGVVFRSLISKSVQSDEVGKVFSILGMFQVHEIMDNVIDQIV